MVNKVKPLIDGDLLVYQVGFAQQKKNESGELEVNSFDSCIELLDSIVTQVCEEVWATEPPTIYITGNKSLFKSINKTRTALGKEPIQHRPLFRDSIAKTTPYKDRKADKPFHYQNLMTYIVSNYDTKVANGLEADDLLAIDQCYQESVWSKDNSLPRTIICSRDKDLRMVPGKHYSWPCYKSEGYFYEVDEIGTLDKPDKALKGTGLKFFYAQCLTGDRTDNVPGLPDYGPVKAFKLLKDANSEQEFFDIVMSEYIKAGKNIEYFLEQANLLWIIRELNSNGEPILFNPWLRTANDRNNSVA